VNAPDRSWLGIEQGLDELPYARGVRRSSGFLGTIDPSQVRNARFDPTFIVAKKRDDTR
jgi:hypothetical protein